MMRLLWPALLLALAACKDRGIPPVGGDRDKHGCLPSGGYTWCAKERRCIRLWEFAKERNFPSQAAAEEYCRQPAK